MTEERQAGTTLVVGIHGVSDPGIDATTDSLAALLQVSQKGYQKNSHWIDESEGRQIEGRTSTFYKCSDDSGRYRVTEGYWADIVRQERGFLTPFFAFYRLLFGTKKLVQAAQDNSEDQALDRAASRVLTVLFGPILGNLSDAYGRRGP